jgi:hypothetical protein
MKINEIYDPSKDEEPVVKPAERYVDPNAPVAPAAPKKKAKRYVGDFDTHIQGIPCQVLIASYSNVKGSYSYNAPSDMDYYGYTDMDYGILDRRGYPAPWLERKMTQRDRDRIEQEIIDYSGSGDEYEYRY